MKDIKKIRAILKKYSWEGTLTEEEIYLWVEFGIHKTCELCKNNCKQHNGVQLICSKFVSKNIKKKK